MRLTLPSQALPNLPALSENRIARFAAIMVLYFLQGYRSAYFRPSHNESHLQIHDRGNNGNCCA